MTLLKMLNGLIKPDAGGGALIALGAGFNPIFDRSGTEGLGSPQDEQPKVGPKGAAPKERRKSKYLHQWLRALAHEKALNFSSSNTNFKP